MSALSLLHGWLSGNLESRGKAWFGEKVESLGEESPESAYFLAFSRAPRFTGKPVLQLTLEETKKAREEIPGWQPEYWSLDEAARAYILGIAAKRDTGDSQPMAYKLYATGDVRECAAVIKALSLLPSDKAHLDIAREGARTNMKVVFESLAHRNPYPAAHFDEDAWNQLVLKALFVESPLYPIYGLDERANPALARMLIDYARERWAASRPINPELWRCVAPFAGETNTGALNADALIWSYLKRAFEQSEGLIQKGVALALSQCPHPEAGELLEAHPQWLADIKAGRLSWETLSKHQ